MTGGGCDDHGDGRSHGVGLKAAAESAEASALTRADHVLAADAVAVRGVNICALSWLPLGQGRPVCHLQLSR